MVNSIYNGKLIMKTPLSLLKRIILLFSLCTLICGCETKTEKLNQIGSDAEAENKFLAVMGLGIIIPGTEGDTKDYIKKYGYKVIPGTSDTIKNPEHLKFINEAHKYAEKHNKNLILKLNKLFPKE
ncbi:MAG: hypothetical protein ACYTFY_21960 [Planctomycetota bacterium]|jgi:hypothetical protein